MSKTPATMDSVSASGPWYRGITRYQWLVLVIASLGWIFDVFEGQVFVAGMEDAMPQLLPAGATSGDKDYYNNISLAAFLFGGALGGVLFGAIGDRIGRTRAMIYTILIYSIFTCLTALAQTWWQMAGLRFIVAMGVGGEWAVASALVAEVFPPRARARSSAIFHASSVLGTYLAVAVGVYVINNPLFGEQSWRWAFVVGALPALLTLWIRWKIKEPEAWQEARRKAGQSVNAATGRISDLFEPQLLPRTLIGVALAAIGMATFWGVHIHGKDVLKLRERNSLLRAAGLDDPRSQASVALLEEHARHLKNTEMLGMFLVTTGGGLGLLAYGPLCERIGRRAAFRIYHAGGFISGVLLFSQLTTADKEVLWIALPIFGFLTLGMHAGYAVYFPELFPTRARSTGGGFCFNVGRVLAAPILLLIGRIRKSELISMNEAAAWLSCLFLLGFVVLIFSPETKDQDLPE
jgi:MFS family permease